MTSSRRARGTRLIEWTGERMVPWAPDVPVIYEHLHRYWFAAGLARGRRVLDVGSGEGYGTAILASAADSAVGVELDGQSVIHSRANYAAPNLEFRLGSALDLSSFADGEFGLVTCFEVIEHLAEQEQLMSEIARVMAPGGILACSTPDRVSYSEVGGQNNPFHVHELDEPEFRELLAERFEHVRLWGQHLTAGATMYPLDGDGGEGRTIFVERESDGRGWSHADEPPPVYMIAVASAQPLPETPGHVALADPGIELVRDAKSRTAEQVGRLERGLRDRRAEVWSRLESNLELERTADDLQGHIRYLYDEIAIMNAELRRVHKSIAWRLLEQARGPLRRPDGERNALGRTMSLVLARAAPLMRHTSEVQAPPPENAADPVDELLHVPPLRFPEYETVKVSIVIAVHDQAETALACLRAASIASDGVPYEVIVVDDASGPETAQMLARMHNLRVLRNGETQGLLQAANRGATAARGEHVVFLGTDTEAQRGWLSSLVDLAESAADIGAVGAKLLLSDGRVHEAGAIVWRDGSARHVGRGQDPQAAALNYVREVDYASGACLLVRGDVLRDVGGFDARYAPAHYEDVDLCFQIRSRGLKVLYQPRAEVIRRGNGSPGSDVANAEVRHVANAAAFADRWRDTLEREQPAEDLRLDRHADRARGPRVLVVDQEVPRADEDAGSLRMREMLLALRGSGCRVTFLPDDRKRGEPETTQLQQAGIEVLYGKFDERELIRGLAGDLQVAILRRPAVAWHYLQLLRELAPETRVIYDRGGERQSAATLRDAQFERSAAGLRGRELDIIRSCDETIALSAAERDAILAEAPETCVCVLCASAWIVDRVAPSGTTVGGTQAS